VAQTLFNQPHPALAAVPWQANAGIAKKLSSRGYATTSWTSDAPQEFAELGFAAKSSGFSAAHYQPTRQPLSQQAKASLALLEADHRNESLGQELPAITQSTETNEHLPFVMDAYAATRKSKLQHHVAPAVLKRAIEQAELADTLVLSPITSDDVVAEPIVIHPDVPDAVSEPVAALAEAEQTLDVVEPPQPELPAVVGGIAPEEVAQREAEQFAKGMAQAQQEAAQQLAQAVELAKADGIAEGMAQGVELGKAEGLAEGLEQGKADGLAEGLQQGITQGIEQGKTEGLAEGEQAAREAVADEMAAQRVLFETAATELNQLLNDPKKFFEPLKRLALHIAEQVVVGELRTSSTAIERLVQRCLDELDHPTQGAVVVELNPEDKARLQTQASEFTKGMRLEAVHDMRAGSVRVFANDTVIEDLVEHRLEGLAHDLLVNVDAWREKSPLIQEKLDVEEEAEDDDVHS
jgi:flagellar biosynthesis/type III secretory pathway protein FliH